MALPPQLGVRWRRRIPGPRSGQRQPPPPPPPGRRRGGSSEELPRGVGNDPFAPPPQPSIGRRCRRPTVCPPMRPLPQPELAPADPPLGPRSMGPPLPPPALPQPRPLQRCHRFLGASLQPRAVAPRHGGAPPPLGGPGGLRPRPPAQCLPCFYAVQAPTASPTCPPPALAQQPGGTSWWGLGLFHARPGVLPLRQRS